jgi:Arc/MetJ family transcription regulator
MRTNIDIEENLLQEAKKWSGAKTKKETVEIALNELIRIKKMKILAEMRGKVNWEGNLDKMRTEMDE